MLKKAEPLSLICVMVSVAVPVFVMVKGCVMVLPMTSLTKLMEVELRLIAGAFTVRVAVLLITVPAELLTTTSKVDPLSAVVAAGVV